MQHDNLRDNIGQVISDLLSENWDARLQAVRMDIFDSRNIDLIADDVVKVVAEHQAALIDKVDLTLQLIQQTFGDRDNPPKVLVASIALSMAAKLREHITQLKAA